MRSYAEIRFRLRQEAANLYFLLRQPTFGGQLRSQLNLPDGSAVAKALRGSNYSQEIEALALSILKHRFPILGIEIETGPDIRWRRDYLHGKESGTAYFKRIPYLDFATVGDHKLIWELNRHQHLVLLAQAYLLTDQQEFVREIGGQLESWLAQNPFQRGINWASALEVAFRCLSWIWVYHLAGDQLSPKLRDSLVSSLYQHGLHLSENLSVYFSPNTHLLGEAVALFALGTLFPQFPGAGGWVERSRKIALGQMEFQVKADGSHFEQSTYYHVYALDFFLLFYMLAERPKEIEHKSIRMVDYLTCLLGPHREIDLFGDDDGGRLFHPYGRRSRFGRASVAMAGLLLNRPAWRGTSEDLSEQAAWWLGPNILQSAQTEVIGSSGSRVFEDSGTVFLQAGEFRLQMDCGSFGFGGAGHSHSDTLSMTLRYANDPVLVDPGTFTYMSDVAQRNWFRGSGAHNSIRVDHLDQADPVSPFRWAGKPKVKLSRFEQLKEGWFIDAECEYRSIRHRRQVCLSEHLLLVLDEIDGAAGNHACEQIWQLGSPSGDYFISTSSPSEEGNSWFSPAYGKKVEGRCIVAVALGSFPMFMAMRLTLTKQADVRLEEVREFFQNLSILKS